MIRPLPSIRYPPPVNSIDVTVSPGMSLMLIFESVGGNTSETFDSLGAGAPPDQLPASDQSKKLELPVQVWAAGASRPSRTSSAGRKNFWRAEPDGDLRFRSLRCFEFNHMVKSP